jgi:hypothetical protein
MKAGYDKELCYPQSAYQDPSGYLYLPHYKIEGLYIGLGGKKYYPSTLEHFGCTSVTLQLWPRAYMDHRQLQ